MFYWKIEDCSKWKKLHIINKRRQSQFNKGYKYLIKLKYLECFYDWQLGIEIKSIIFHLKVNCGIEKSNCLQIKMQGKFTIRQNTQNIFTHNIEIKRYCNKQIKRHFSLNIFFLCELKVLIFGQ
jgi:hypothetical protein